MDIRNRDNHYYHAGIAIARIARTRHNLPTDNKPSTGIPDGTGLRPSPRRMECSTGIRRRILLMGLYLVSIVCLATAYPNTVIASNAPTTMPNGATMTDSTNDPSIVLSIWNDTDPYLINLAEAIAALWGAWWAWTKLTDTLTA